MNTNVLTWIGIFIGCFVLQSTLVPVIGIMHITPDLLMIALFYLALRTGQMPALWVGFFLGLAQDLFSPSILGQNALAKTVAGFFAGFFNDRVMRLDPVFQLVILFVTFIIHDLLFYLVQVVKNGNNVDVTVHELIAVSIPRALYSLVFALVPFFKDRFFPSSIKRR
jgi:rod shape-determining protein MreD